MESLLPDTPESQQLAVGQRAFGDQIRAILATGDFEKAARMFMDVVKGSGTWEKMPPEEKQEILENIGTAAESVAMGKASCADIQKFNFPVLLLNGERSPKIYGEMTGATRQCKPDISAPLIVPNGTHSMNRDNPEFFNKAVLDYLNQH